MTMYNDDPNTCRNSRFNQGYGLRIARLDLHRPRTTDGKKVMTWDFRPVGLDESYPIEVTYHVDDGQIYFAVRSRELGIALTGTDIDVLRQKVEDRLALASVDASSIAWEDWLEVRVSGDGSRFNQNEHTGMGAELKIHVQRLKRGWHEASGCYVTIGSMNLIQKFPEASNASEPERFDAGDIGWLTGDPEPQTSYIPETPENLAALEDVQNRMIELQNRLMELLHQDEIGKSLQEFAGQGFGLLPNLPQS